MEDSFKTLLFAFILMSLFGMLILSAVISIGNSYSMNTTEVVGGSLSLDKFNNSISNLEQDAKDMEKSFSKQSIWSAVAGVVAEGIFGIGLEMIKMILTPFDIIADILSNIFGVPFYVASVILGLLIFTVILAIWRLLKIGD